MGHISSTFQTKTTPMRKGRLRVNCRAQMFALLQWQPSITCWHVCQPLFLKLILQCSQSHMNEGGICMRGKCRNKVSVHCLSSSSAWISVRASEHIGQWLLTLRGEKKKKKRKRDKNKNSNLWFLREMNNVKLPRRKSALRQECGAYLEQKNLQLALSVSLSFLKFLELAACPTA